MPPEARNGPSESTPTTQPKQDQSYSQRPTNNLRSLRYIRASTGHLLGLLANIFLDFQAHTLPPPLKQPKTVVSCEQFGQPGSRDNLSEQPRLT